MARIIFEISVWNKLVFLFDRISIIMMRSLWIAIMITRLELTNGNTYTMVRKSELPSCKQICPEDRLVDETMYNRSWTPGDWSIGSKATYVCTDKEHVFHESGKMFPLLELECVSVDDQTSGIWQRIDWKGEPQTSLPKCDVIH